VSADHEVGWTKAPNTGIERLVLGHSTPEHARARVSHVSSDQPRPLHTSVLQGKPPFRPPD
jgi:hypothetical protein